MQPFLPNLWQDVRFAARIFAKRPAFTAIAALTLALGIGAATAVFSIVDAVVLRPLPYKAPDRLTAIWITSAREKGLAKIFATYADYLELRRHAESFDSASAATWATATGRILTGYGRARQVLTIPATASFFDTLGVPAAIGRTFRPDDEGRGCSLVLAHKFWTSTLGADPSVSGKILTLDQAPCRVLGVMPQSFAFYPSQTEAWILLGPGFQANQDRMLVGIFARLRPGTTRAQAQTEAQRLYRASQTGREARDFVPVVYDLHGEFTFLASRTLRTTLLIVLAAVLLVLFIACLNVANLLLVRLSERSRELAVRAALGSGQSRLIRQLLTESLLLALSGAAIGIAIAFAAVRYFSVASPIELTAGAKVEVNFPVLSFGVLLSILTTLVFGLLPAVRASRIDLTERLKTGGRGSVRGRRNLARIVIALEMAGSFVLLIGAGLLMTSALRMGSEPLGFDPDRLVAARIALPASRYSAATDRLRVYDRILTTRATLASRIPPEAWGSDVLEVQGHPVAAGSEVHDVGSDAVSPRFFDLLKIPLRRGRAFNERDRESSQPVAIVNEALVREYFPGADPLGQQIRIPGGRMPWLTVIGISGNIKHSELMNEMSWVETPLFYRPLAQDPRPSVQVAAHAPMDIERQIAAIDPAIVVGDVEPLTSRLSKTLAYPRFRATVFTSFALGALLLAAIGLHGVLAQLVSQRVPEFGVRKAVGAQTHHLLWLVVRQGGAPVLAGLAAGIVATLAFSRVLRYLLYGIQPAEPRVLAIVSIVLLAVAALAMWLPARRAAGVDPMVALREE